jgi:hypothetical protein
MNAAKFVDKRLSVRADVVDGMVQVYVEDSGPRDPTEEAGSALSKFRRSGLLNRYWDWTGVCETLVDLFRGENHWTRHTRSGMEICPEHASYQLNTPAILLNSIDMLSDLSKSKPASPSMVCLSLHKKSCLHDKIPNDYRRIFLSIRTTTLFFGNCSLDPCES